MNSMPAAKLDHVVQHLRRLASDSGAKDYTDAELLHRFVVSKDEVAFTTLVTRHRRLIGAVCRHVLSQEEDVEDAVQATLLVLVRRADSIRKTASVASWLYGTAYRTAMNAKKSAIRCQAREKRSTQRHAEQPVSEAALRELQAILDEEVLRLPENYRTPFVLCCLEGKSKAEAAHELCWKEGTVSGRLARARKLLRVRLARRGIALSAALCAVALDVHAGSALSTAAVMSVLRFGAGEPGLIRAEAAALAKRTLKAALVSRWKLGSFLVLALGTLTVGTGLLARHTIAARPNEEMRMGQTDEQRPGPKKEKPVPIDQSGDALPAGAFRRLGTLRFRHGGGSISSLLLSADGKRLISNTYYGRGKICVWEMASGRLLHEFPGHFEENGALALSPDGKVLATGSAASIHFWDLASGSEVRQLNAPLGDIQGLAFSADGKALASGHAGQTVLLWDLAAGKTVARLPAHHNRLNLRAFTPDGKTLVTGDWLDRTVRLFDVATRKERQQLTRPEMVRGMALSADGGQLALGTESGHITVWDVNGGKIVRDLHGAPFVPGLAFSPDGKALAAAEWDQEANRYAIQFWDLATGQKLRRLEKNVGPLWRLIFSNDGKTLIGGDGDTIRLWDVLTGEERTPAAGNPLSLAAAAVSPDGRTLAYEADFCVRLWDVSAGHEVATLPEEQDGSAHGAPAQSGRRATHWSLAFSPDGRTLAGGRDTNEVDVWDVVGRRLARRLVSDPKPDGFNWIAYYHLAFSPDGKVLASAGRALLPGGGNTDEIIQLWDLATGRRVRRLTMKDRRNEFCTVEAVAFSPDGKTLAASGRRINKGSKLCFWDLATGQRLTALNAMMNEPSDQGTRDSSSFPQSPIIQPRLAFSPDGKTLALNRSQKTIPVWETASGKQRCLLAGHEESTIYVTFSPDGRTLASSGWDNTIRLWDLDNGMELRKLTGHRGPANSLVFTPDGRVLISTGLDTTVLFWDVAALTHRVRAQSARLSEAECEIQWQDLAASDAAKAYQAIARLSEASDQAVALLQTRLEPTRPVRPELITQWIRDLNDDRFAVREKATHELEQQAEGAQAALSQVIQGKPTPELRRRAEALLDKLASVQGERLRMLRAVEVLERCGTPDCRRLLEKLATGQPAARLTEEAKASLARLARISVAAP